MISKLTLGTKNLEALKANLRQYSSKAQQRAQQVVIASGQRQYERTYELCPVDTGHMRDNIQLLYTPGGLSYQVGWIETDFVGANNIHTGEPIRTFYPLYQEFGTTRHPAHPCLFPARDEERPRFRKELAQALSPRRGDKVRG